MLLRLKMALLRTGVRQTRMAFDLGWDPAKLSRIFTRHLSRRPEIETQLRGT
jgi:hypothetical protein